MNLVNMAGPNGFLTNARVYVWIIFDGRGLRRYTWEKNSLVFKEQLTKANGLSTDNVTRCVLIISMTYGFAPIQL